MLEHITKLAEIGLLNLIVYYKTIYYGYVGDDAERAERPQEFKNIFHRWWLQFIGLKHRNSMVAHLITLITHTICCLMIYLGLGKNNISFLAAILFSIHPINMQGSIWISGRNYVVSTILALMMFMFPYVSWIFYASTSYFAVNAWFAPLVFLGTKYWHMVGIIPIIWILIPHNRQTLNRKLWETAGLKTTNTEMRAIKLQKIIPFLKNYTYYLSLTIFPWKSGIEHNYLRGFGTNATDNKKGYKLDWVFYLGFIVFSLITISSIWCIFHGWHPIFWGLFWFTVNIAMWCNFITYQQAIAERYVYLANVGIMYALANLIINHPILITIFITAYFIRLWYVMDTYLNDWWAVEYNIREFKNLHYAWMMRGVKKYAMRDYPGALYDFNEAYIHKPYDVKILYNLAMIYFVLGNLEKSKEFLEKARKNIYDEAEEATKPAFESLESLIKTVEEGRAQGQNPVPIDLRRIMIVK